MKECASNQSDQDLLCWVIISTVSINYANRQWKPWPIHANCRLNWPLRFKYGWRALFSQYTLLITESGYWKFYIKFLFSIRDGFIFRGVIVSKLFYCPSENGLLLKEKNMCSQVEWSKSFQSRQFSERALHEGKHTESYKSDLLYKQGRKRTKYIHAP